MASNLFQPLFRPLFQPLFEPVTQGRVRGAAIDALTAWLAGATYADWNPGIIASLAQNSDGSTPVTTNGDPIGRALDQGPGGFNATQATAGSRPLYLDGYFSPDGTADNLLTSWVCGGAGNTLILRALAGTPVSERVIVGTNGDAGGSTRFFISQKATGVIAAGIGAYNSTAGVGTTDVTGKDIVAAITDDGVTSKLFLYVDGIVTTEFSAAKSGTISTTIPHRLCALNVNGVASNFFNGDLGRTIAAHKAMTVEEFTAISPSI